jgi:hypothetical protein
VMRMEERRENEKEWIGKENKKAGKKLKHL